MDGNRQSSIWCYPFPPLPPLSFFPEDSSSGPSLSPLVIALIGILASALLLASYYLLISRYCGGLRLFRRRLGQDDDRGATDEGVEALRSDAWQQPPPASAGGGLEEWIIRRIVVCRYKKGDGLVESTDCSVCLGEFRDGESLRLLPDCLHAFHVSCINTWLKSNSSCPLCRANIMYTFAPPSPSRPPPPPPPPRTTPPPPRSTPPAPEIRHDAELAQDAERGIAGERNCGVERGGAPVRKDPPRMRGESRGSDGGHAAIKLSEEGIQQDAPRRSLASVADVLRINSEGGPSGARNGGAIVEEVGSSRGFRAEQHA
ncbi:hypothetical protein Taro_042504 [Colocasia esculenta]|uniref:RING-type E3 ubiquitin transferase n=1 Tax=Colocasia esculenta TaxID=4460 RepID=A0A843WIM1_COLES|nr:hypothetical protein [Colocasia esculenta]